MRKKIKIGKPYIEKVDSDVFGNAIRLCAEVNMENPNTHKMETKVCYYEFEEKYEKYLCPERSDTFVTGLLSDAMENDMDIETVAPISERLYYSLSTYYIPLVSENNSNYPMHYVKIEGPTDSTVIKNEKAVATGCSGGVDSFYTIAKHSKGRTTKETELTHLVFSSTGIDTEKEEKRIKNVFETTKVEVDKIAKECNLDVISCYTNLYEFYLFPYKAFNTFSAAIYASVPFALQKLINIYYLSSTHCVSFFNIDLSKSVGHSSAIFDLFSLSCLDNENLKFYSTGMEVERLDKEKYIADFLPAQKHLSVCGIWLLYDEQNDKSLNCSFCNKCLRTMCHFYAFDKLNNFKKVFDVEKFMANKSKCIGKFMGQDIKYYVKEFKNEMKNNHLKIPFCSYIYAYLWYKPIKSLKKIFTNSLLARKIYYKLNLDYKLEGYRSANYDIYKDKITRK